MGTTLTAAYSRTTDLAIAHVGDSRAYLFRDGELARLTQDHSLVEELVRQGKLTEEQAAEHPQRSIITRALGIEGDVEVDTWTYPVRAGDVMLLCSDGLTSMIGEEQIVGVLAARPSLDRAADSLIDAANDAGGRDNITVVLFRLEEVGDVVGGAVDAATMVGMAPVPVPAARDGLRRPPRRRRPLRPPARPRRRPHRAAAATAAARAAGPELARTQGPPAAPVASGRGRRRSERCIRPVAALIAIVVVLFLVGGGGYLASRQLYFIGTNSAGRRHDLPRPARTTPLGIDMYEKFYVSGVPAGASRPTAVPGCSIISCARRATRSASCMPPSSAS